jgi:uncharacterized membrane protein YfcA
MSPAVIALAAVLSFAMGLSLGLLGGGGSVLAVPILVYVLDVETKAAIASSLLVVGTTAAVGLVRHAHVGNVRWRTGLLFAGLSMIGAYAGGRAAAHVPGAILLVLLGGTMIATAIALLRSDRGPTTTTQRRHATPAAVLLQALALGGFMGLIGAGGGFLLVPTLLLLGGLSMHEAIATSLLVIALNSVAGFAGHVQHATVDWTAAALVAGVAAGGAVSGGVLATHLPPHALRRAFACLILGIGVFLLAEQLPPGIRSILAAWWPLWLAAAIAAMALVCRRALNPPGTVGAR